MNDFTSVKESFERCDKSGAFSETFYDIFLSKSDEVKEKFKNTDFAKQKKLLRATVKIMATRSNDDKKKLRVLNDIGRTHNRHGYNIEPELYKLWLESLCETIAIHDPEFSKDLEKKWRTFIKFSIDKIINDY